MPAAKVGIVVAMASMTVLFAALVSAYVVRMGLGGWESIHVGSMPLLWVNTGALVLTSIALGVAWKRAHRSGAGAAIGPVTAATLLGVLFVAGQGLAWHELRALELFVATTPASSFFYVITGIHGLHILGGLVALALVLRRLRRSAGEGGGAAPGPPPGASIPTTTGLAGIGSSGTTLADPGIEGSPSPRAGTGSDDRGVLLVELSGLYWHFLLAVWLVFFALMLVT